MIQINHKDCGANGSPDGVADEVLITIDTQVVKRAIAAEPNNLINRDYCDKLHLSKVILLDHSIAGDAWP